MMAGRPQQLHHLILTATDTLEVEAEKKLKFRMSHYTAKHRINGQKKREKRLYGSALSGHFIRYMSGPLLVDVKLFISQSHGSNATNLCL